MHETINFTNWYVVIVFETYFYFDVRIFSTTYGNQWKWIRIWCFPTLYVFHFFFYLLFFDAVRLKSNSIQICYTKYVCYCSNFSHIFFFLLLYKSEYSHDARWIWCGSFFYFFFFDVKSKTFSIRMSSCFKIYGCEIISKTVEYRAKCFKTIKFNIV